MSFVYICIIVSDGLNFVFCIIVFDDLNSVYIFAYYLLTNALLCTFFVAFVGAVLTLSY